MNRLFFSLLALVALTLLVALAGCKGAARTEQAAAGDTVALTPVAFNADSAMAAVQAQCAFGARTPGSEAHRRCGDYLVEAFTRYNLRVTQQTTTVTGWDGKRLPCRNLIASYAPERSERVVIAAHWDSRPWADADPDSTLHRQPVMAANDGASGIAVMLELARLLPELKPAVGVDLVCFDVEDYGAPYWAQHAPDDGSDWCLGSRYWAQQAAATGYTARYGVLLDMVGGRDARFCFEGYSLRYAEAATRRLWSTAATVGGEALFLARDGSWATDDHVPMNEIARIPTVDVIPYIDGAERSFGATWHTTHDTPENISRENLRLVGQTLLQMLFEEQ